MFTANDINELLKPWSASLDERPVPTNNDYAYEEKNRQTAWDMASKWEGEGVVYPDCQTLCDFICHQSDVIEMLAHALSFANKRLMSKK